MAIMFGSGGGFGGDASGPVFTPRSVSLGQGPNSRIPYINNAGNNAGWLGNRFTRSRQTQPGAIDHPAGGGNPLSFDGSPAVLQRNPQNTLNAEAVRATGSGPFDSAYRQNLATYAGGNFFRPGGNLTFDPTSSSPFPSGQTTGGGNAPLTGLPTSLTQQALGGNPFSFTPPQPQQPQQDQFTDPLGFWRNQFGDNGNAFLFNGRRLLGDY